MTKQEELMQNYENLDLERLPELLRKGGFDYKLIKRENHKCLYAQQISNRIFSYEVFTIKIVPFRDQMIALKLRTGRGENPESLKEFKEVYPGDEEFGRRAWSFPNLDIAIQEYDKL